MTETEVYVKLSLLYRRGLAHRATEVAPTPFEAGIMRTLTTKEIKRKWD